MAICLQEQIVGYFDSESLVQRLRQEKKEVLEQVREQGFNFGIKSASSLSYPEFHRIECLSVAGVNTDSEAFAEMWELLDSRHYQKEMRLDKGAVSNLLPCDDDNKAAFVNSWMAGVLLVWNQIKNQVDEEAIQ
ncbi:hypothetical protein PL8927_900093 [Planktothrix serta PCC 8927]|uniref:Uncharacterized protein n=1 Tax=Planktothrix serta PCC 8927 TaxID=671068 RepID=A0A7Z9BZP3_9CYAN|nr:hypothetical protein [Planktothrix serta]VXD25782.1 hypothetical protein PL8927_900093 [Planktothrix serta PCC 8927]